MELIAGDSFATCSDTIPVLKRFSGGGTVIVDKNTVFTTFICNVVLSSWPCYRCFPLHDAYENSSRHRSRM